MALRKRIIPVLMMDEGLLYKSVQFKNYKYIGDPVNAVRIFNEKAVDELILLDVGASRRGRGPNLELLRAFANECFMPLCYGGGVRTWEQVTSLFSLGIEKLSFNRALIEEPKLVTQTSLAYGAQAVVASIDLVRTWTGRYRVHDHVSGRETKLDPVEFANQCIELGAGEILITSVNRDGMRDGYDLDFMANFCQKVTVPTIICGGAGDLSHLREAAQTEAQGVAAGSLFVLHGKHKAVLITYPSRRELYGN